MPIPPLPGGVAAATIVSLAYSGMSLPGFPGELRRSAFSSGLALVLCFLTAACSGFFVNNFVDVPLLRDGEQCVRNPVQDQP